LGWNAGELNLTAMIDVAFQLLAFFIMTIHQVDVFTNIDAYRPSPDVKPGPPPSIRITVDASGYALNEQPMGFNKLEDVMTKVASHAGKDGSVLITCRSNSMHAQLVQALNLCAKLEMGNLLVVSSN